HKAVLDDNGFRVGQIIGPLPAGLQTLLTSDRFCVTHWGQILPAGRSLTLAVSRDLPEVRYQVLSHGQPIEVELEQAQAHLTCVPALTPDGRTRLRCTPEIQSGDPLPDFQAAPDRSGWLLAYRRQHKTYSDLAWEVAVAPNEHLVIGASLDNPE